MVHMHADIFRAALNVTDVVANGTTSHNDALEGYYKEGKVVLTTA